MTGRFVFAALALALTAALGSGQALAEGDAAKGKKVFNKCKTCHSLEAGKKKVGPDLANIVGRAAGSVDGFKYSKAMKNSGLTWDEATLNSYLEKPRKFVKGTKMSFRGIKSEEQRIDLIAYLKEAGM